MSMAMKYNRGWCIATCVISWIAMIVCIAGAAVDGAGVSVLDDLGRLYIYFYMYIYTYIYIDLHIDTYLYIYTSI
jgi:hypothetical protein